MIKPQLLYGAVKEIETNSGQWYQVMTMPYIRQSNHTQSGAIITFRYYKIKKTHYQLDEKNKSLQCINDDLDNFVYVASTRSFIATG